MKQDRLPAARLDAVTLRYGKVLALNDVTLVLPAGGIVGLIGRDGAGKSSVLSLIAGARRIQTGAVQVLGGDMASVRFRTKLCPRVNQRAIGTHDQRANGTRTSGCTGRSRAVLDAPAFVAGFDDVAVMGEAIE
jgi:ABC-type cobalamin/Fe3+-siderophores transport system ATPase subunit